ncbi:MAG TPA: hypothetical protein VKP14_09720 [Gaiellaceae bacterium]|nr:hypothetical protein [Gaiellaceae bacterium]
MLIPLALLSILAACGGSGKHAGPARIVVGKGYTYTAPASSAAASVSVSVFTLRRNYVSAQFDLAAAELDRVAAKLVSDSHGKLTESATTTIAGRKARAYRYSTPKAELRVAFVLAGRHEYELLCKDANAPACALLLSSFSLG